MTYQLRIQLKGVSKPPVWRSVLVPSTLSFHQLHIVIQAVFGWFDCHLYQFSPTGYGSTPTISPEDADLDSGETPISSFLQKANDKFTYIYDFGDDWTHSIVLEEIKDVAVLRPVCVAGKGFCPPEDCGGIYGYAELKRVFKEEPDSEEALDLKEWLIIEEDDEVFDPNYFDLEDCNEVLKEVF